MSLSAFIVLNDVNRQYGRTHRMELSQSLLDMPIRSVEVRDGWGDMTGSTPRFSRRRRCFGAATSLREPSRRWRLVYPSLVAFADRLDMKGCERFGLDLVMCGQYDCQSAGGELTTDGQAQDKIGPVLDHCWIDNLGSRLVRDVHFGGSTDVERMPMALSRCEIVVVTVA
jgi:hypothetical protein